MCQWSGGGGQISQRICLSQFGVHHLIMGPLRTHLCLALAAALICYFGLMAGVAASDEQKKIEQLETLLQFYMQENATLKSRVKELEASAKIGGASAKTGNAESHDQQSETAATSKPVNAKQHIQKTTSDWLEAERTNILLLDSGAVFQLAQRYYDAWPSKWYQPDLNGDGKADLVMFGIRTPSNVAKEYLSDYDMCGLVECKDWAVAPFMMIAERVSNRTIQFRKPVDDEISDKRLIARTSGGKTIFADFNGDGLDDIYVPTWGLGANKGAMDSLLMSSSNGKYEDLALTTPRMNVRSLRHWASAGDIDNDGDIDIIAGDLGGNNGRDGAQVDCFSNDGKGNFSHSFCLKLNSFSADRYRSWGGTLFDLDADGDLDLWVSLEGKKPAVFLGDGTGHYSSNAKIDIEFPKSWPAKMRQIGYVMAADVEDDGFVDIFFSVQGKSECGKTYCGSYVGYFKNEGGNLKFKSFIEKVEEDEPLIWSRTSMIVVKDLDGDGLKDVYLKRNYSNPIYLQNDDGFFESSRSTTSLILKDPVPGSTVGD
ncbi:hypothetical protein AB3X55_08105 [Alphaproteobacteria bacterium LSUCC0719]